MELEYTSRYLKQLKKLKNKRSVEDTDKIVNQLMGFENLSEILKSNMDVKFRDVDKTYRIRYSGKPEMRIIFVPKEVVDKEGLKSKRVLELIWVGTREDYKRFAYNRVQEEIEEGLKIMITENQFRLIKESEAESSNLPNSTFSPSAFAKEVYRVGILHPEIAIAQSILETGNFTSNLFKKNNNLFGMKHPRQRSTTSKGEVNGHAFYSSWEDSVLDYKLWQVARNLHKEFNKQNYLEKLNKIYCIPPTCGTDNYADTVRTYLGKARKYIDDFRNPKSIVKENRYMGKSEGDLIRVGSFSKLKMPKPVVKNVLKSISNKIQSNVSEKKLRSGEYDDVEIRLFGQLLSFLTGTY